MQDENSVRITVPLIPPSVNHYKMRTRRGVTFVTDDAKAFKAAVCYCSLRHTSDPFKAFSDCDLEVEVIVYQGKGDKGDVDNYAKCVLDGLVEAGVIRTDAAITDLTLRKRRDRENPRTEINIGRRCGK
jgi:Holliday junction resolvase RusA-like endonuclease